MAEFLLWESQAVATQEINQAYQGKTDKGVGITPLQRLEQDDAHSLALEAAGTIQRTFGLHIATDGGFIERTKMHGERLDELLGMAICSIDHAQPGVKDDALALCPQQLLDRLLHRAGFAEDLPVTDAHLI